ncbi:hypothetical protein C8R44DRAFT_730772 [Mycena epipterygia]|nr:hypothetical protein C8R44DRAFT_730772 [Mycena epipterygia]
MCYVFRSTATSFAWPETGSCHFSAFSIVLSTYYVILTHVFHAAVPLARLECNNREADLDDISRSKARWIFLDNTRLVPYHHNGDQCGDGSTCPAAVRRTSDDSSFATVFNKRGWGTGGDTKRSSEGIVWSLGTKGCVWRPGANEFFVPPFDVAREATWQGADPPSHCRRVDPVDPLIVESATSGGVSAPSTLPLSNFGDGYATVHSDTKLEITLTLVPMPPWMSVSRTPSFRAVLHADMPEQFQIHRPATLCKVREDYGPMEDHPRLPQCYPNNFANPVWLESAEASYLSKYGTSIQQLLTNFRALSIQIMAFEYWYPSLEHPYPAGLPADPYNAYYVPSGLPRPVLQSYEPLDTFVPEAPINCYDSDKANALFQRNQANMAKWLEQDSQRQKDHVDKNRERIKSLCAVQTQNWLDLENDRTRVLHRIRQETNSVGEMIYFKLTQEHPPVPALLSPDVLPSDPSSHTAPLKRKHTSTTEPPEDDAPGNDIVMGGGEFLPISHIDEDRDSEDDKPILLKIVVPLVVQGTRVSTTDGAPTGDWHLHNLPSAFWTFPLGSGTGQGRGYPVTINGKYVLVQGLEEFGVLSESLPLLVFFTCGKGCVECFKGGLLCIVIQKGAGTPDKSCLHCRNSRSKVCTESPQWRSWVITDRALSRINVMWIDLLVRAIIDIFTELLGINVNEHILHSCLVCRHSPNYAANSLNTTLSFPVAPTSAPSVFASTSTSAVPQPATFAPSDIAVAQLTSLLSSPDQPVFKSLLDGLVKKIVEDGLLVTPDLASDPQNDGSTNEVPPRDISRTSMESGDGLSKAKGKGKAKADVPPRAHQHTTSPLISSGLLRFGPSPHIGGTSSFLIAGFAAGGGSSDGLAFRESSATSSPAWASQPPCGSPSKPYSHAMSTRAESVTSRHSSQTNVEDLVEQDAKSSDTLAVAQSLSSLQPSFRSQLRTTDEDHNMLKYGTEEDLQGDTLAAVEATGMDTSEG